MPVKLKVFLTVSLLCDAEQMLLTHFKEQHSITVSKIVKVTKFFGEYKHDKNKKKLISIITSCAEVLFSFRCFRCALICNQFMPIMHEINKHICY